MKIALAQIKPVTGDVSTNITNHLNLVNLAISAGADTILFPELSLTGYEPALADALATTPGDDRFDHFQTISNQHHLTICVGLPVRTTAGTTISLLLFQPGKVRSIYSKQYLHPDEEPFFVSGHNEPLQLNNKPDIALAICYELSVTDHAEKAHKAGASIYLASVAKSVEGVGKACERLSRIAEDYSMAAGMANCLGINDGMLCGGRSSVWNRRGELIGQLDDSREGILLFDTEKETAIEIYG